MNITLSVVSNSELWLLLVTVGRHVEYGTHTPIVGLNSKCAGNNRPGIYLYVFCIPMQFTFSVLIVILITYVNNTIIPIFIVQVGLPDTSSDATITSVMQYRAHQKGLVTVYMLHYSQTMLY